MSEIVTGHVNGFGLPGSQVFWRSEFERVFLRGSGTSRATPRQPGTAAPEGLAAADPGPSTGPAVPPPPTPRRDYLRRLHARTVAVWLKRTRERGELLRLGHRELRDIGLTRAEVAGAVAKPFWQA
jgi:uncharacterized protein YjiS (DUF1127 family)